MSDIYVYSSDAENNEYSTMGLMGALIPTQCTFHDCANGECEIEMTHPLDDFGRYSLLEKGNILSVPVPTRTTPEIQNGTCVTTVWTYTVMDASLLTHKKQRTLYRKKTGSSTIKVLPSGTKVTVVSKPTEGDEEDIRWKVKTEQYGTGWMYPEGLEDEEEHIIPDHSEAIESIVSPWTVQPQLFRIYETTKSLNDITVRARHITYDLLYNITSYKNEDSTTLTGTLNEILNHCYAEHDFHAYTNVSNEVAGLDYSNKNPIEAFLDPEEGVCKKYNVGLIRNNYDLYFLDDPGVNRGVVIEYGKNLTGIEFKTSMDEVATRIIPVGEKKDGSELYLSDTMSERYIDSEHINDYPEIHCYYLKCENCKVGDKDGHGGKITEAIAKERMRYQAQKLFDDDHVDIPNVEMSVEFVNLGDTEEYKQFKNLENCFTYDYIIIRHPKIDIDVTAQITEIEWDCLTDRMNSVTIGTVGKSEYNTGIASWQIPNGFSGSKISNGTIDSNALKSEIISANHIQSNTINANHIASKTITAEQIAAETITGDLISANSITTEHLEAGAVTANKIDAGAITTEKLDAYAVTADKIQAGTITASRLDADSVNAMTINATKAYLTDVVSRSVTTDDFYADIATIANARIHNENIDFSQILEAKIGTAIAEKLITHDAVADRYFIEKLHVKNLQVLDQTCGNLVIKASNGNYYKIDIDPDTKTVSPTQVEITSSEAQAGVTSDGTRSIIETDLLVSDLSASNIKGINALIDKITSERIDVDTLFARTATIGELNNYLMRADTITAIEGKLLTWAENIVDTTVSNIKIGVANLLVNTSYTKDIIHTYTNDTGATLALSEHGGDYPEKICRVSAYNLNTDYMFEAYAQPADLVIGEEYTFSVDVSSYGDNISLVCGDKQVECGHWSNSFRRVSITFTATVTNPWLCIRWKKYTGSNTYFDIRKLKLEIGNKATEWSRSYKDDDTRYSQIIQTQDSIIIDVTNVTTRLGTAETTISQNSEAILLKANQTEVDALGTRIATAESAIEQTPEQISAAVYEMQVGGPNLLIGSDNTRNIINTYTNSPNTTFSFYEHGDDYPDKLCRVTAANHNTDYMFQAYTQPTNLVVGEKYTFSADVASYGDTIVLVCGNDSVNCGHWSNSLRRVSITFTAAATNPWLCIRWTKYSGTNTYIDIRKLKLEKGSQATAWCLNRYELNAGSSLVINKNGIRLTGNEIKMTAGTFQVDASSSENSYISLGEGNFSASKSGGVTANDGHFKSLDVSGSRVLTLNDISKKIIVATAQPSGHNIVWLKPSSVSSLSFYAYTANSRDSTVNFASKNPITKSLTPTDGGGTLPNGTFTLDLTIPLYSTGTVFTNVSVYAILSSSAISTKYTFATLNNVQINDWELKAVTLTGSTTTNFFTSKTATLSVAIYVNRNGQSGSLYLQKETNIIFKGSLSSGGSAQTCTVYYVP